MFSSEELMSGEVAGAGSRTLGQVPELLKTVEAIAGETLRNFPRLVLMSRDDLTQEVFVRLLRLRDRDRYREIGTTLLRLMARQTVIDHVRKVRLTLRDTPLPDDAEEQFSDPRGNDRILVSDALSDLQKVVSPKKFQCLLLALRGLQQVEIAATLGLTPQTISGYMRDLEDHLRRLIFDFDPDPFNGGNGGMRGSTKRLRTKAPVQARSVASSKTKGSLGSAALDALLATPILRAKLGDLFRAVLELPAFCEPAPACVHDLGEILERLEPKPRAAAAAVPAGAKAAVASYGANAYAALREIRFSEWQGSLRIVLVGSVAGGTGAGVIPNLAHLVISLCREVERRDEAVQFGRALFEQLYAAGRVRDALAAARSVELKWDASGWHVFLTTPDRVSGSNGGERVERDFDRRFDGKTRAADARNGIKRDSAASVPAITSDRNPIALVIDGTGDDRAPRLPLGRVIMKEADTKKDEGRVDRKGVPAKLRAVLAEIPIGEDLETETAVKIEPLAYSGSTRRGAPVDRLEMEAELVAAYRRCILIDIIDTLDDEATVNLEVDDGRGEVVTRELIQPIATGSGRHPDFKVDVFAERFVTPFDCDMVNDGKKTVVRLDQVDAAFDDGCDLNIHTYSGDLLGVYEVISGTVDADDFHPIRDGIARKAEDLVN